MSNLHAQSSLPALPAHQQSDTNLTSHLASRYHIHCPVTHLSTTGVVSINTYTASTKGPNGDPEGSAMAAAEDLAARSYARLGHRQENQAVVFLGESGSGKTTLRSHLLSSFLAFSSTPLSKRMSHAAFVFDALTTTKTASTPTASKAGLFYELQYDTSSSTRATLIGGKILDHRLERSRVGCVPAGERNFHVLYYLLAGTSPAEKEHLGLDLQGTHLGASSIGHRGSVAAAQRRWRYLGHPSQLKVGINDAEGFQLLKTALRNLAFHQTDVARMCEILAAILHIGQLEFQTSQSTTPAADESGGYGQEGGGAVTTVKNKDVLSTIAAFLGVPEKDLEQSMGYRTKTLHRERVTIMLDPKGARENADELARTLYALLVALIMERINQKICADEESVKNTVSIIDFPGFALERSTHSTLDQLLNNAATESLYNFCLQSYFERKADLLETEEVQVPATSYFDNSDAVKCLLKSGNGLLSILDDQMRRGKTDTQLLDAVRKRFDGKNPAIEVGQTMITLPGHNFATKNAAAGFTIKHFAGEVDYPVNGLLEANGEVISGDLMTLVNGTTNPFVAELFGQEALCKTTHPKDRTAVTQASVASKPSRVPSMAKRGAARPRLNAPWRNGSDENVNDDGTRNVQRAGRGGRGEEAQQGAAAQFLSSLDNINKSLSSPNTNPYFFFCLKPNDRRLANQFDSKCVRAQVQTLGIAEISQRLKNADLSIFMPFSEFLGAAEGEVTIIGSDREKAEMVLEEKGWPNNEARIGSTGVFLSERCWMQIAGTSPFPARYTDEPYPEDGGKRGFGEPTVTMLNTPQYHDDKTGAGYFGSREIDARSEAGVSVFKDGDMFRNLETRSQLAVKGNDVKAVEIEQVAISSQRRRWLFIVWTLTWYIPDFAIKILGRMPRKDVRMAWREKLAINLIIWLSCLFVVFFMIGFPRLICPIQKVYSVEELTAYDGKGTHQAYVAIRGVVFDLGSFAPVHYPPIVPVASVEKYAGIDATNLFPVQVSAMCQGTTTAGVNKAVQANYNSNNFSGIAVIGSPNDPNAQYHDFRWATNDSRPTWFTDKMLYLQSQFKVGNIGYSPQYITTLSQQQHSIAYINNRVYDFTQYVAGGRKLQYPSGYKKPSSPPSTNFMDGTIVNLFQSKSGQDITKAFEALPLDPDLRARMQICMDNLFYVGDLDTRGSPRCLFAKWTLLGISILLVSVICGKFLAALQFGRKSVPENLDKFIIATVPAYTEDEESLRRAIDSAARLKYDDKRKLLFIVCDGMIIGQGNDKPTPRIVLDILGVPESADPEPLSFESLGEGLKQHNMAKVYTGLYEVQGHIVPFVVVVKVGKPSEVSRPGNRGKRDSQMILMRFLNRIHYNLPMTPLELELHHQIRNVIGVNPTFYEFLLQIDADTVVAPDSATRFVASFLSDTKLIACCGETALSNAKASFITMMQVYEYYISHNLTKAFESLFGSVTCLPGCFSMYRIRAAETGKPLFVSREIVEDYAEIRVDTLHSKNLLHLGEDRFLTTLLLKHHSKYKTKYVMRAHAWTIAPDSWAVFMSQRRRWINSTVHNLIELIPLQQLCGFCCFSMRFVVFIDLLSTIVQPVIVCYLAYLIVICATSTETLPITAFILLGAIYGLQAIIFIFRRKWEMIGWMIIYVLALPIFSLGLPLYAFWHMDDFSWGNTRLVTGEKGRQVIVSDEGKFDPSMIPRKKWEEYQAELWDAQTMHDDTRSEVSGISYATKSWHPNAAGTVAAAPASEYGGLSMGYHPPPSASKMQYAHAPPHPSAHPAFSPYTYPNLSHMSLTPSETGQPLLGRTTSAADLGGGDAISRAPSAMSMNLGGDGGVAGVGVGGSSSQISAAPGNLPTDDALLAELREILRSADLMSVTKKSLKAELERRFGVPLDAKRAYIGSAAEAILGGQL